MATFRFGGLKCREEGMRGELVYKCSWWKLRIICSSVTLAKSGA